MTNKTKHVFKVSYDTSKTKDHTIDAELLGNAIIKMSSVLKNADKFLNGEDSTLDLDVQANSEGSFVVEFVTWLAANNINVLSVLGFAGVTAGAKTILDTLKELKSRPIKHVVQIDKNNAKLVLEDGSEISATPEVSKLIVNKPFRQDLQTVVKAPLDGAGNAKLIIKDENDKEISTFVESELQHFEAPKTYMIEEVKEEITKVELHFVKVNFYGPTGWTAQLINGDTISIKMRDENFLARINENKKLSKGDLFVVEIKTITTFKSGKSPSVLRELTKVLRHRAAKDSKMIPDDE
ncbi:hypothetical protein [Pseudoalteromonas rubra]|uniref:hypothetical protein n=1 Tax=Pseudoalteromonas rubra TaxID=43658 RepID=UPI0005F9CD87|nr:hypothetical protein [Pseudoalteromonas rubra]